ncbi:MAG: bifunctional oligoribonuclease/PAP phosphatase NrnA [Bacilli bacterium]|nr:bifunctional oligoribonuclease/PAP phosphatase NrnA [Bacilli bacterium]
MSYPIILKNLLKNDQKALKTIQKKIIKSDKIVVFRHQMPDFDALGCQFGLVTWLKDNFPKKEIHYVGENHVTFTPRLYPYAEELDDKWFEENKFLAIICDTADTKRISDERYSKAEYIIKIDHHPNRNPYGDIAIVHDELSSCGELIANICYSFGDKYKMTKEAAHYLYAAIAGDSGRFLFNTVNQHTFEVANLLIGTGFELNKDVYSKMYVKNIDDLKVTAYVLGHFKVSKHGIAYYVLDDAIQKKLKITPERGKENVNLFKDVEGVGAWCSITENPAKGNWKVSIRSKQIDISQVAEKYNGGGHANASGCELATIDELPKLIKELDELFK